MRVTRDFRGRSPSQAAAGPDGPAPPAAGRCSFRRIATIRSAHGRFPPHSMPFRPIRSVPLLAAALACAGPACASVFGGPPEALSDSSKAYRLSRNPGGAMAYDAQRQVLHLTYWSGGLNTSPSSPAAVYYRTWTPQDGMGPEQQIDDSFIDLGNGPVPFGGRESTLAVDPANGEVWVAWHDHRHCDPSPPANGIDNLEIYANRRLPGGAFLPGGIRLTETDAGTLGDNGYSPDLMVLPGGGVAVAWHDYHFNTATSDLFLRISNAAGAFDPADPVPGIRLTDGAGRSGALAEWSFPDLAPLSNGALALAWTAGTGGAAPVFFAEVPDPPGLVSEVVLAEGTAGFFDPPRLVPAPNGDLWALYTKRDGTVRNIEARRRPAGAAEFDPPAALAADPARQEHPHAAFDAEGRMHLVFADETAGRHVRYKLFSPEGAVLEDALATTSAGPWQRPVVALDENGAPMVLWEEELFASFAGRVWFRPPNRDASVPRELWEAMR